MEMETTEIEALLRQTIGLDSASVGLPLIERAIQQRVAACKFNSTILYLEKLRSSPSELQELIEAVVVSETWFFRDHEAFVALGHFAINEWLPANPMGHLRLLSIPCATGEEPYSLAMTLDGIGLPLENFQIDAVDISEMALARARKAVYGRNSFRGKKLEFRDQYFEAGPHGYRLSDKIRRRVIFQQANLLGDDFFPGANFFHFIFCRNLLIYLDQAAQNRAIQTLKRLLTPQGLLFVGPAETALMLNHDLVSAKRPLAFAFRKGTSVPQKQPANKKVSLPKRRPATSPVPVHKSHVHLKTQRVSAAANHKPALPEKNEVNLDLANRLADEGKLKEAIKVCENYLKEHPSSADAFYLLGVIHDAGGNKEKAGSYYRKVLYLDPEHYESLMHLSYSEENVSTAKNLRARAERIKERKQHA